MKYKPDPEVWEKDTFLVQNIFGRKPVPPDHYNKVGVQV
jgi:hypothetical protein